MSSGPQHLGWLEPEVASVDALVDGLGGNSAQKMSSACWGVAGLEMGAHARGEFGLVDEARLPTRPQPLGPRLSVTSAVVHASTVTVDFTLHRGAMPAQRYPYRRPRHGRVLSQASADLLSLGDRQARVGHDGQLQQSVRW